MTNAFRYPKPMEQEALSGVFKVRVVGAEEVQSRYGGMDLKLTFLDAKQRRFYGYFNMAVVAKVKWLLDCGVFQLVGDDMVEMIPMQDQPPFYVKMEKGKITDMKPPKND